MAGDAADGAEREIKAVVVAGIVDDPDVGHDIVLDASAAIAVDNIVDDQSRGSICRGGSIAAAAEIHDDAVSVGVIAGTVVGAGDDVVGDDVVQSLILIEPLTAVVRDGARPSAVIAVVVKDVVVGRLIVAAHAADAGRALVDDGVLQIAQVMGALAEEAVGGDILPIESKTLELDIAGTIGEVCVVHVEHVPVRSIAAGRPEDMYYATARVLKGDPGIRVSTVRWIKAARKGVVARLNTHNIPGNCTPGGTQKSNGGRRRRTRVLVRSTR